jgi:quercetin dioxygenase-like cupin family protein
MKTFLILFMLVHTVHAGETTDALQWPPEEVRWTDAPGTMPPGSQVAVLEGHPQTEGIFTMRIKAPAGTRLPPHTHPKPERVTVLSGAVHVGFGTLFDRSKARKFPAGSFYVNPPDTAHFIFMDEETVIQITGEGPWRVVPVTQ